MFIQAWMYAFVKLFYVWSGCVVFVCGLEHMFVNPQKLQTLVDHIVRISNTFKVNFSPY